MQGLLVDDKQHSQLQHKNQPILVSSKLWLLVGGTTSTELYLQYVKAIEKLVN